MSTITKTQQFTYLQNKARHYDNLKKVKPVINTFRTIDNEPKSPRSLSSYRHSINIPIMKQYDEMKANEALVNGILQIRQTQRPHINVHNYSRYNDAIQKNDRNRQSAIRFRDFQSRNQIDFSNSKLGTKILKVRPSVGTMVDWNKRNQKNRTLKKIASRYKGDAHYSMSIDSRDINQINRYPHKRVLSIYSSHNNHFIPQQYRTFLERDGSTVALRQRLFELPKQIEREYLKRQTSRKNQLKMDLDWRDEHSISINRY